MNDLEWIESLLDSARAAGAVDAEAYVKRSVGRRVVLEPLSDAGHCRASVSTSEERGIALRVRDAEGRWGFAWRSAAGRLNSKALVEDALGSAGRSSRIEDPDHPGCAPCAPQASRAGSCTSSEDERQALQIHDQGWRDASVGWITELLGEAVSAAASAAGRSAAVDRVLLSTATTTIRLVNSRGFFGEYEMTPALLSVSMIPLEEGARPSLEERSSCRIADIDPRLCGEVAARRSLPRRPTSPPLPGNPSLVIGPRAAASFLSAWIPSALMGGSAKEAPIASRSHGVMPAAHLDFALVDDGRLPGMIGSAPFDGVGKPTGRRILARRGIRCGRLSALEGNTIRPSYREPPSVGPTTLLVEGPPVEGSAHAEEGALTVESGLVVETALFEPASESWRIRVLRGDWYSNGEMAGPADGVRWEGSVERILSGVAAFGRDLSFFHIGQSIGAPSLRIEGLGPWIVEAAQRRAGRDRQRVSAPRPAPRQAPRARSPEVLSD
jgi:PmbA protein